MNQVQETGGEKRAYRLALAALNQTPLDWSGNLSRIRAAWAEANRRGADFVLFPELCLTGYGCEDMFFRRDVAERALRCARELAAECGRQAVFVGLPFWLADRCYNAVAVLNEGRIRSLCFKTHLAREGIHYEPRWFHPWPLGRKQEAPLGGGETVPAGALAYEAGGLPFALEICEDAWVDDPGQRPCGLARQARWIFNASASHFSMKKADIRERVLCRSSEVFQVGYAYANLVGCESGRAIYDGELIVVENGRVVNRSERLFLDDCRLLIHEFRERPEAAPADVILTLDPVDEALPAAPPRLRREMTEPDEEFAAAATLALFDYLRKSRARGFVLSLSGGVDSAAVATLVYLMVRRVLRELTPEARRAKLGYIAGLDLDAADVRCLTGQLLTTAYQATRNSGEVTRQAAAELATAIGARHLELDVDALAEGYQRLIGAAIGRELVWERDDIALQNIQARVRGPSVWMLANLSGALLLTTSNRSEAAVGYATMDGDTCGGLAPIAGVEKSFLRRWLRVVEGDGLSFCPPIAALGFVNRQQPTAELRPATHDQTDEADLMPYEVLDALESALIFHRHSPREAFRTVAESLGDQYSRERLLDWTEKFCRLFAASQWKRERFAPAFHLDDQNLDPKTWARFPILSGGYAAELADLRAAESADDS